MGIRVLIVHPSAIVRAILGEMLYSSAFPVREITEAISAEDGIDLLESRWFDLALVGFDASDAEIEAVMHRIRNHPPTAELPLVLIPPQESSCGDGRFGKRLLGVAPVPVSHESFAEALFDAMMVPGSR